MAVQNSTPADLIVMDHNYEDRVLERRQLMAQNPAIVVGLIPQGRAAVEELYSFLLSDYLPQRFPAMFSLSEDGKTFRNKITRASFPTLPPDDPVQALRRLGETVEDDMFLLHETEQGHRSVAYVCCYCSGFDPSQKLDKLLSEIHKPVPSYEKIGLSMERYFKKLEVGKNVKRVNWSVVDSAILFNCKSNHVHEEDLDHVIKDEDIDISKARLRCELQTLCRLPKTGAILFSFKTYLYTLEEIKSEGLGPQLADAIDGLGKGNAPGMWQYKGALRLGKKVNEYLRS
ncbi:putative hrq family protein 2 [Diaporthe ampelina]|uniref:Putative hrq family protein 2 n=1 Tax=Diaporthe ampelina TaxID=1214573 RepID=A0A0G2FQ59_9PEZI|nr:putative hrq family protein 2 [Diaporthe ampelina]